MITSQEFHNQTADRLTSAASRAKTLSAFVGLDGFVDEILEVVDTRYDSTRYDAIPTIGELGRRLVAADGAGTNIELVSKMTKLGGNGPIMANALAMLGLKVSYLGSLGYPGLHPIFEGFSKKAEVASICGPGLTDALEFGNGKIMVGKHYTLKEVNWENICGRYGLEKFARRFGSADLVGFVNWTMLPFMSDIWESIHKELMPVLGGPRRRIFFDLADPEKRTQEDILRALDLILKFQSKFDVILGLNKKEALEIGVVLGLPVPPKTDVKPDEVDPEVLAGLVVEIQRRIPVETLVVHPVTFALAVSGGVASIVAGPSCGKPKITTGAGDHFNAGFCFGKLLGLDNEESVLCGVSTSGHYVRTSESPTASDVAALMKNWPQA